MPLAVLTAFLLFVPHASAQNADAVALARSTVDLLAKGEFAAVVARFDEKMRAALPEEKLRATWQSVQSQTGALQRQLEPRVDAKGDYQVVVIPCEFAQARADVTIAVDRAGAIAGLNIRPAAPEGPFSDAPYVDRKAFTERDATVDAGGWPLPATLSVPAGAGPFPAVVLVHGSGPHDRDESIGPNKPFRDLAHGLASRGVAVLRYEKRTRIFGAKIASIRNFTVQDETIDDAAAAVRLLSKTTGVDTARIVVVGHSLGAMLAPRIATAAGETVRGLVLLAAPARSLEQSIIDQTRYLAALDGTVSDDEKAMIASFEDLAARVKTVRASDPPLSAGPLSAPASYWVDLRDYDATTAAAKIAKPMLILQGERDYQVTMDDFKRWQSALSARRDVTFKPYPTLNHLFAAGTGPSAPPEYMRATHVDAAVIADIAAWVGAVGR